MAELARITGAKRIGDAGADFRPYRKIREATYQDKGQTTCVYPV